MRPEGVNIIVFEALLCFSMRSCSRCQVAVTGKTL